MAITKQIHSSPDWDMTPLCHSRVMDTMPGSPFFWGKHGKRVRIDSAGFRGGGGGGGGGCGGCGGGGCGCGCGCCCCCCFFLLFASFIMNLQTHPWREIMVSCFPLPNLGHLPLTPELWGEKLVPTSSSPYKNWVPGHILAHIHLKLHELLSPKLSSNKDTRRVFPKETHLTERSLMFFSIFCQATNFKVFNCSSLACSSAPKLTGLFFFVVAFIIGRFWPGPARSVSFGKLETFVYCFTQNSWWKFKKKQWLFKYGLWSNIVSTWLTRKTGAQKGRIFLEVSKNVKSYSRWWFQPVEQVIRQNGNLCQIGVEIRHVYNHHLLPAMSCFHPPWRLPIVNLISEMDPSPDSLSQQNTPKNTDTFVGIFTLHSRTFGAK